jgi:leader peptidase (prepilin peptidase)/N-methyltransferase
MLYILIFLFGLTVGSFLNVVICRLETKEPIFLSRSHCPYCGTSLKWFDNIPLLSFVFLGGRCRYCRRKISYRYPLVELATGLLFLSVVLRLPSVAEGFHGLTAIASFYYLVIISFLVVIFVYDLKHYLIPDKIVYPAIGITLLYQLAFAFDFASLRSGSNLYSELVEGYKFFTPYLLSAVLSAGFFFALVVVSKGKWMGLGDVKLAGLIGLVLGWPNILLALFLAFLSGAIIGLLLVILGKKGLKSQIPFGPFLAGATILVILFGQYLTGWWSVFLF